MLCNIIHRLPFLFIIPQRKLEMMIIFQFSHVSVCFELILCGKKVNRFFGFLFPSKVKATVAQSCPAPCNPMDDTVHGILQASILEWVAFPFSRGSPQPRD